MSCLRRSRWTHASGLAAGALLAAVVPAASARPAAAAECKHGAKPGYELRAKRARRATACLINKQRRARGLSRLKQRAGPRKAAKRHTRVMVEKRCFSHVCPGEKGLAGRLAATGYLRCGCSWGLAENIAYAQGRASSPRQIVKGWMRSPQHRANLLNRSFEHLGIGIRRGAPSGGRRAATYTTDFGYRN
jgi:uncharacterized protein YkwD